MRALLEARERASNRLEALVVERTIELERANARSCAPRWPSAPASKKPWPGAEIEDVGPADQGIAHDFSNLLMVIAGGLDMLDRRADSNRPNG